MYFMQLLFFVFVFLFFFFKYILVCFIFGFMVVCLSMGSWTLLQTILMAFLFFSYCIFVFCKLPLDCNK